MRNQFLMAIAALGFCSSLSATVLAEQAPEPLATKETRCIETEKIKAYKVESDALVRIFLTDSRQILLRLKHRCPQLRFHRYISYTPTDGKICAGVDEIKTRAGLACRIGSFTPVPDAVDITEVPTEPPAEP